MSLHRLYIVLATIAALLVQGIQSDSHEAPVGGLNNEFDDDILNHDDLANDFDIVMQFDLEHLIPSVGFTSRGSMEVVWTKSSTKPTVMFKNQPTISELEAQALALVLHENGFYTIRAKSDPTNPNSHYVMTSIPLCQLSSMNLKEDLTLHVSDSGELMALEYLTPYTPCTISKDVNLQGITLAPLGTVVTTHSGPVLPQQVSPKKEAAPQGVKPAKGTEETAAEDNPSFLRKYWYIILPVMLFSMLTSEPREEGGGGGAAAAGAGAGGARRR